MGFGMPALCADTDVAPTFFGFAADDGECGILLYIGQTVGIHEGSKEAWKISCILKSGMGDTSQLVKGVCDRI